MLKENIKGNHLRSKYKPKIQKSVSETEHTVITEKNRRVHKNQITGPVHIQPGEQLNYDISESTRRPHSKSPRRRSTTPKHQRRNAQGKFTRNPTDNETEMVGTNLPGASTPMNARDT